MRRLLKSLSSEQIELGFLAFGVLVCSVVTCMVLWYSGGVWLNLWRLICAVVEPLAYGIMLSYIVNPLVKHFSHFLNRFPRYANNGVRRRTLAVTITVCLIAFIVLVLLSGFGFLVAHNVSLDWSSIESLFTGASEDIMGFLQTVQERLASWGLISKDTELSLLGTFTNIKDAATTALFTVIFTIYNLVDGKRVSAYAARVMRVVFGGQGVDTGQLLADADRVFSAYFRGQAIDATIVGVLTAISLTFVGVPYAPVIGLLTGLGNLIPYIGGPVGFGSIALMCLTEEAWGKMIVGFVVMAVVMFVDGNIINPKILSDSVEVHPILVVAALIVGGGIGGIAGMLVAVPAAAWLKIQFDRWMDAQEARETSLLDGLSKKHQERD